LAFDKAGVEVALFSLDPANLVSRLFSLALIAARESYSASPVTPHEQASRW
jgi:hypothetical protein